MRVGHHEIPVTDPLRSLVFYRDALGFELAVNQGDRFLWLTMGETTLLLRPGPPRPPGSAAETPNLVLYSQHPETVAARLRQHDVAVERHGTCLYFQDPDGHWFQLVNPHDDHSDPSSSAS